MLEATWLALALLVPVVFSRWSYDAFELPKQLTLLSLLEIGLLAAAVMALALAVQAPRAFLADLRRLDWWRHPAFWAALAVAAAWLFATALSAEPAQSWWGLPPRWGGTRPQLAHALLFLAAALCLTRLSQLSRLAIVSAVAGAVAAAYAVLQRLGRDPFEWAGFIGATQAADVSIRPFGTFGNPNFLAGYLALALPLTAGAALSVRPLWARTLLSLAAAFQLLAVLLTQTRGAWVGLVLGAAVFATLLAAMRGLPWKRWLLAAGGLILLALIALRLAAPFLPTGGTLARAASITTPTEQTAGIRLVLWQYAWEAFQSRPVTGYGPDALGPVFLRAYDQRLMEAEGDSAGLSQYDRSENALLDTLLAAGALGALALLLAGLTALRGLWLLIRHRTLARNPTTQLPDEHSVPPPGSAGVPPAPRAPAPDPGAPAPNPPALAPASSSLPSEAPLIAGVAAALAAHLAAQQFNVEVVGASFLAWLLAGALAGLGTAAAVGRGPAGSAGASPAPLDGLGTATPPADDEAAPRTPPRSAPTYPPNAPVFALMAAASVALVFALPIIWQELRPVRAGIAYETGLQLARAGRPAQAIPHLQQATQVWPHYHLFWAELAYAQRGAARAAPAAPEKERLARAAVASMERALAANSSHPLVWSFFGDIGAEVGAGTQDAALVTRAKEAHARATTLAPSWWRYWQAAGETSMLLGDFPAAKQQFARATELYPRSWTLWASLGDAANRQGDRETALSAYQRALTQKPDERGEALLRRAIESLAARP